MSSPANLWVLFGLGVAGVALFAAQRLRRVVKKDFGAFVSRLELLPPPQPAPPKAPHPLTGLTFAIADVYHVIGHVTGFGNSDWMNTQENATQTALVVSTTVEAGATCIGKTVIDEMAYSVSGVNKYYGMPINPAAPERVPGGCSSGSAVAVSAGIVDFSLGVDTIGGVRIPASFCGVLGFRPSHGAVSTVGIIPIAPSLDTVGWFAKDPTTLRRVGHLLLQLPYSDIRQPRQIIIADDCFELSKIQGSRINQIFIKSVEKQFGRQLLSHVQLGSYLASKVPSLNRFRNGHSKHNIKESPLLSLAKAMQMLHRLEFKNQHSEWISSTNPALDSCIKSGLASLGDGNLDLFQDVKNEMRLAIDALLKDDGILVLPTVLDLPPKLSSWEISSDTYAMNACCLSALCSMSGSCQATVPLGTHQKCAVSISLIAKHGCDRFLLDMVQALYAPLQEQVDITTKSKGGNKHANNEEAAESAKEKGNAAYKEKQYQKAASFYSEAIKFNEQNATYYSNRAAAYLELKSFRQAEADCTRAIDLDQKNVKAYLRRGTAREMLGYYKEAAEDFRYALVLEPTNKTAGLAVNRLKKLFP